MVYVFGTGGVKWAGANCMEWAQRRTVSAVTREAVWLNRSFASATARRMKSAEKCGNGHRRCLFENQLRIELRFTNQKNNELIHQYQGLDNLICHIPEIGHKYIGQYLRLCLTDSIFSFSFSSRSSNSLRANSFVTSVIVIHQCMIHLDHVPFPFYVTPPQ